MDHFELKLAFLLWNDPLCRYAENGELNVLLSHSADHTRWQRFALQQLLQQGQLKGTALHIYLPSGNPAASARMILQSAPTLARFVRIEPNGSDAPLSVNTLAQLHYFDPKPQPELLEKCRYALLLDTEHNNNALAAMLPQGAFAAGQGIFPGANKGMSIDLNEIGPRELAAFAGQVEPLIFNLQRIYEPDLPARTVRARYNWKEDGLTDAEKIKRLYSYRSNLFAAIHLHAKTAAFGVALDPDQPAQIADALEEALTSNPKRVRELAVLEHDRWCLEKCFSMRQLRDEEFEAFFYRHGHTTHGSDWHCSLVSARSDSRLTTADFSRYAPKNNAPQEKQRVLAAIAARADLDELDKTSLKVRAALFSIALQRKEDILRRLHILQNRPLVEEARQYAEAMELALDAMYRGARYAVRDYSINAERLKPFLPSPDPDLQYLEEMVRPLQEFALQKDYKDPDLAFARQIPFILSHREDHTVFKLVDAYSANLIDDTAGVRHASPEQVVFVSADLNEPYRQRLEDFVRQNCLSDVRFEALDDSADLSVQFAALLLQYRPLYLDFSGCSDPQLLRAAFTAQNPVPSVVFKNGKFQTDRRDGLTWLNRSFPRPIPVQASLQMAGNHNVTSTSVRRPALMMNLSGSDIDAIWSLASKKKDAWRSLCAITRNRADNEINGKHDKKFIRDEPISLSPMQDTKYFQKDCGRMECETLTRVLRLLQKYDLAQKIRITPYEGDDSFHLEARIGKAAGQRYLVPTDPVPDFLKKISDILDSPSERIRDISINKENQLVIKIIQLTQAVVYTPEREDLLNAMKEHKLLSNLTCNQGMLRFRLKNAAVASLFENDGSALECYTYQKAQLVMDSAEHSVVFCRENSFAEAELDVVATKNEKTLFISCKDVSPAPNKFKPFLNEVRYEAEHYGWNGVPVLVTTAWNTFEDLKDPLLKGRLTPQASEFQGKNACLIGQDILRAELLPLALEQIALHGSQWYLDLAQAVL